MAKKKKTKSAKTNALREKKNKSIVLLLKEIQANPALGKVPLDKAMQIVFEAAISRIMPQYYDRLVDAGLAIPETAFENLDTIKMSGNKLLQSLSDPTTGTDTEKTILAGPPDIAFYRHIPCFIEGILLTGGVSAPNKLNEFNTADIYFKIKNLDPTAKTMTIMIQGYVHIRNANDRPMLIRSEEVELCQKGDSYYVKELEILTKKRIRKLVPAETMGWSEYENDAWRTFDKTIGGNRPDERLYKLFFPAIAVSNYIMDQAQEAATDRNRPAKTKTGTGKKPAGKTKTPPNQVVHEYDGLRLIYKARHVQGTKNGRNYVTPVWTVKGHIRRYKSGKISYIPPTVMHRKSLLKDGEWSIPAKSVAKITG